MLHCFSFIIFHRPVIKKILIAGRKCYSCNIQVSVFIDVWRLHAAIPCACMWNKISIYNPWELGEFKMTCKLVFNRLWKPSVSSLYFLYKPNQKNISTLKYAFLIQIGLIIFLFLPFKLFISSWSLWSNSTHPDESSRVENSKACRHTKYGN